MSSATMIKIEAYTDQINDDLMELMLKADPDKGMVIEYLKHSSIYVALDDEAIIGVAVLVSRDSDFELKNIVVRESYQGRGIAKRLITTIKNAVKKAGGSELFVGTGNSSLSQLALYQKCGFRLHHIEKEFFVDYPDKIFENGIQCLDMVVLSIKL